MTWNKDSGFGGIRTYFMPSGETTLIAEIGCFHPARTAEVVARGDTLSQSGPFSFTGDAVVAGEMKDEIGFAPLGVFIFGVVGKLFASETGFPMFMTVKSEAPHGGRLRRAGSVNSK